MTRALIGVLMVIGLLSIGDTPRVNSSLPMAQLHASQDMLILPTTVSVLSWDVVNYATTATYESNRDTRLRAPRSCVYHIIGQISFDTIVTGEKAYLYLTRNGVEGDMLGIVGSPLRDIQVSAQAILNQGDFVEMSVYIEGEASRRVLSINPSNPSFSMVCIAILE